MNPAITTLKTVFGRVDPKITLDAPKRLILFGALANGLPNFHSELSEMYLEFRADHHNDQKSPFEYEKEFDTYASTGKAHFNAIFNILRDDLKISLSSAERKVLSEVGESSGERAFKVAKTPSDRYQAALLDLNDPEGSRCYDGYNGLPPKNTDPTLTRYFARKGLTTLSGSAFETSRVTIIPLSDLITQGRHEEYVYNHQTISDDGSSKLAVKGLLQKSLVYFVPSRDTVYSAESVGICEGAATAESVYQSTGIAQIATINKCNLLISAVSIIEYGAAKKILYMADTAAKGYADLDKMLNTLRAGGSDCLVGYVVPELEGENQDFNDLMVLAGSDAVKVTIDKAFSELVNAPHLDDEEENKQKLKAFVAERNLTHAKVFYAGKVLSMHARFETELIGENYETIFKHDFESLNELVKFASHKPKFKVGEKYVNPITAWANHSSVRAYSEVKFQPYNTFEEHSKYNPKEGCYNLWQGYGVTPADHGITYPYLSRLIYNICDGNASWIKYLYDWIALGYQKPHSKVGVALCIRGREGSGKGSLLHLLRGCK